MSRRVAALAAALAAASVVLPAHGRGVPLLVLVAVATWAIRDSVRRHAPRTAAPWHLLNLTVLLGGLAVALHAASGRPGLDLHPVTEALIVGSLGCNVLGNAFLLRARTRMLDRYQVLDLAVILVSALVAFQRLALEPAMEANPPVGISTDAATAFILLQLTSFVLFVRFMTLPGRRPPAAWLLLSTFGINVLSSFISNVWSPAIGFHALTYPTLTVTVIAALHPSMRQLTEPSPGDAPHFGHLRITALGVALVLAPVTAAIVHARDETLDLGWFLAPTIGVTLLVLLRLRLAFAQEQAARTELVASRSRFRALIHGISDVVLVLDDDDRITYASASSATALGRPQLSLLGRPIPEVVHEDDAALVTEVAAATRGTGGSATLQIRVEVDEELRTFEVGLTDRVDDTSIGGIIVILHDVTERVLLTARLRHQALHDALTGLPNRAQFVERLGDALVGVGEVGVLFVDLDDFKAVNDGLGHDHGDELLRLVANRLAGAVREHDLIARIGGDEFAVLVDGGSAADVGNRLLEALHEPFAVFGHLVAVRASVGVASGTAGSVEDLFRFADIAMYRAKAAGKGRLTSFAPEMEVVPPPRQTAVGPVAS